MRLRIFAQLPWVGLLLGTAYWPAAQAMVEYLVRTDSGLQMLQVSACFQGHAGETRPADLVLHAQTLAELQQLSWNQQPLRWSRQQNSLPVTTERGCLRWQVRLPTAATSYRMISAQQFLLAPRQHSQAVIAFDLPTDQQVSHPWPASDYQAAGRQWYQLTQTPPGWSNQVLFGDFETLLLQTQQTRLEVAIPATLTAPQTAVLRNWLRGFSQDLVTAGLQLPVPKIQLLLQPSAAQRKAITFGKVLRGGGAAVVLYLDPNQSLAAYQQDWIPDHEVSHLLLPLVSRRDAWLSEGLASYYQNLLPARAGRTSPAQAWQGMLDGLARGVAATDGRISLREATQRMRALRSYRRVYWSGAALWLQADVELRQQHGQTLDTLLQRFAACCYQPGERWSARRLLQKLDELSDTGVFMQWYRQWIDSKQFPDLTLTLQRLGIDAAQGTVRLDPQAEWAVLRDAIMQPAGCRQTPTVNTLTTCNM